MFLSTLKSYRGEQLNGNLNELINGRPKQIETNISSLSELSKNSKSSKSSKTLLNTKRNKQFSFSVDVNDSNNSKSKKPQRNKHVHYNIQKKRNTAPQQPYFYENGSRKTAKSKNSKSNNNNSSTTKKKKESELKFSDDPLCYDSPIPIKTKKKNCTQFPKHKNKKKLLRKSVQKRKNAIPTLGV